MHPGLKRCSSEELGVYRNQGGTGPSRWADIGQYLFPLEALVLLAAPTPQSWLPGPGLGN